MTLHELIVELEDWIKRLRHHAATVQVPADVSPAPPPGYVAPPPAPVESAPAPVPQPVPTGVNTTDAAAPGFHAPAEKPAPAPVAADPTAPDFVNGTSFDFKWQGANIIFEGTKTKTITGASGKVLVETNVRPNTKPYTLTVNGQSVFQEMVNAVTKFEVEAQGDITVTVSQPEDSSVVMNFHQL